MPGLIESHSHLTFLDTPDLESLGYMPPEEHTLRTAKNAKKMLDQGFTACNSAASAKARLDVVIRNAINAGDIPGPRTLRRQSRATATAGWAMCACAHMHRETFAIICDGAGRIPQDRARDGAARAWTRSRSTRRATSSSRTRAPITP